MLDIFRKDINKKISYSQCGEDLIVEFLFNCLESDKKNGNYIDIGAHHPFYLNNTYIFYKKGWRGVNIDPLNMTVFNKKRPKDLNLDIALGRESGEKDFFVMDAEALSTLNPEAVDNNLKFSHHLKRIKKTNVLSVKDFLKKYNISHNLDILSIDIEGDSFFIIKDFFDERVIPKILICETVFYNPNLIDAQKNYNLIKNITTLGFRVYADTFINTIFIYDKFFKKNIKN